MDSPLPPRSVPRVLSRRRFLQGAGLGGAAGALAACNARRWPFGPRPTPTPETQEFRLLLGAEFDFLYDVTNMQRAWDAQFPYWPMTLRTAPFPSLLDRARDDAAQDLGAFDGVAPLFMPLDTLDWLAGDLIQPWEPFVESSAVAGAERVLPALPEPVRASVSARGQVMGLPINVSSVALAWLTAPLAEAGVTTPPVSWDVVWRASEALQRTTSLTPFDRAFSPVGDLLAMIWGGTVDPYDADGIVHWDGEIAVGALQWLQDMVTAELMPAREGGFDRWLDGRTGIMSAMDLHGAVAQNLLGTATAVTGSNLRFQADAPQAGTPFWSNALGLARAGRNPQAAADFGLWWLGPENLAWHKRIADMAPKPAYDYVYADSLMDEPRYAWQRQAMEAVKMSVPIRSVSTWSQELEAVSRWMAKALDWEEGLSAQDALAAAMAEVREVRYAGA